MESEFEAMIEGLDEKMWQEMRKHEKKPRGMIVGYKRLSERRKEYDERIVRRPSI